MVITNTFLVLFGTLAIVIYAYIKYCYSYWRRRNVVYLEPTFPLGNNRTLFPKGVSIGAITAEFYRKFKDLGLKYGGTYNGLKPDLVVVDPKISNIVMKTAFSHFPGRGIYMAKNHPTTVHIFSQTGEEWKVARNKFTSIFTAAKLKFMFPTLKKCCDEMLDYLSQMNENEDIYMLDILANYTTDVIGNVIFGVACNSFKHPDAEFRRIGRTVFLQPTVGDVIRLFLTTYLPSLAQTLNIPNMNPAGSALFAKCIKETVAYREKNKGDYKDLMELLIEMKNKNEITIDDVIGQTYLFFLAGFETSSHAATMALYELAQHPDKQLKARKEITEVLARHNNELTFDSLNEMKYLSQVFEETLRLWPPVATLTRVCEKDYHIPDTDLIVEEGVRVLIPVLAMHCDADYWPDPEKWSPERFDNEIGQNIPYYPFGEGPRYCLGARFGYMQVKLGLADILRNFQVTVSPKTKLPLEIDPDTFTMHTKQKIFLKLKKIN